ncbi:MAG: SatD family protein [Ignavibacterium sp.]
MKKIVLIGDIVSSQDIKERGMIQKKMINLFKKINENNASLNSPYTITLGDEFQAVYKNANTIFKDICFIKSNIYPIKIRFSIGIGEITTPINKKQSIGMDGPAFYNARKGMNRLKNTSYYLLIEGIESDIKLIENILFLISHFSSNWKKTRFNILNLIYENKSVLEISKKLKVTDKSVYKNINAGSLMVIKNITNEICELINNSLK